MKPVNQMKKNNYDIFISYRRSTGKEIARPLKEALTNMGYQVFLDFDELNDGMFNEKIVSAIKDSPIFMIILSANSLERCVEENDWVRKEIELALSESKQIIPINPDKQFTGFPEGLPQSIINGLGHHQISILDTEQLFKESLTKIVDNRVAPFVRRKKKKTKKSILITCLVIITLFLLGGIIITKYFNDDQNSNRFLEKAEKYASEGKTEDAAIYFLKAAEILSQNGSAEEDVFNLINDYDKLYEAYSDYHNSAYCYSNAGDIDNSIKYYSKAISAISKIIDYSGNETYLSHKGYTLNNLAYVYCKAKDWDNAITIIDEAIKIDPKSTNYLDSKGEILYLSGNTEGARKILEIILEIDPYYSKNEWAVSISSRQ